MTDEGLDWAGERSGSPVVRSTPLAGGMTSTMRVLDHADGRRTVLREIDREPWLTHAAALATREHETQRLLASTAVPAPVGLALDAPAGRHLMSMLPGRVVEDAGDDALRALAALLATVHDVRPDAGRWPREYQSWAWEAKYVVPDWAAEPAAWAAAFDLLRAPPPPFEPTFLHRDFAPRNVLWTGVTVSGLVDWVETSTGPAWLDVAHCATNLALRHGPHRADAFAAAYAATTGREPQPYFDVMDVVGFLPPPGRAPMVTDAAELTRLEAHLVARLARVR